jgi:uncharacterized protein
MNKIMGRLAKELVSQQRGTLAITLMVVLCCGALREASPQSFNCPATKADEVTICGSARLSSLDEQLASVFVRLRNNLTSAQQRQLTADQQTWLRERARCGSDRNCIEDAYQKRLRQLGYFPPSNSAQRSASYQEPEVLALLKYDGTKGVRLQYKDLVITVHGEPSKSDPTNRIPFVTAQSASGAARFAIHLEGDEDVGQDEPAAQVRLMQLDPSASQPQLVFTYYWAGAHCCTITKIAAADAAGNWQVLDGGTLDGDEGYELLDLDRNGGGELVSIDNSFLYAFCSYACSYAPTRIKKLVGDELKDVTTDQKYQQFLRERLRQLEANARASGDADTIRSPGYLGGWVAAKALVGELSDAWQTMLSSYKPDPDWTMEECVRPIPMNQCSDAERRQVSFPEAIAFHLMVQGYITPDERQRLTSIAKAHSKPLTGAISPAMEAPLATCTAAINDPLRPMIIDNLIAGGKHIAPDWTRTFKSEIENDYGSFVTVRDDATVEKLDTRTGKIGCAVTFQADLQGLAQKVLQGGATGRAQLLISQIARQGKVVSRRLSYTVQRTSGGSLMVWFGLRP